MTSRFSRAGLRTALCTLLVGSTLLALPLAPAEAAQQERVRQAAVAEKATKLAEADPATTSSLSKASGEDEPACSRPRRRLWVEGEGWVVRRVSACH